MNLVTKADGGEMTIRAQEQEIEHLQTAIQRAMKHEESDLTWVRTILKLYDDLEVIIRTQPGVFDKDN